MEEWIQQHKPGVYGTGLLILGILGLLFMKYYGDTKEVRANEYTPSISQSNRFGVYFISIICILIGINGLYRELFS